MPATTRLETTISSSSPTLLWLARKTDEVIYCGPSGAGQMVRACNQVIVANTMQAVSEALVFAQKAGGA
jgi:3-hydroxyisobutyrate dehydrogenase-like beta-hydroxyacid dehydrogenase